VTGHVFEGHKSLAITRFCPLLEGWDEANKVLWGMGKCWMFASPVSPSHLNAKLGGAVEGVGQTKCIIYGKTKLEGDLERDWHGQ